MSLATLDVIIATNRRSPFLEEALASVVAQEGVECNIIVVDDGSPCPDYIRRCASNIPRAVVIRQPHAGLSAARNRGLQEGDARFVAFLDDDDAWHPAKSQKQIGALQRHPEAVGCYCWGWYVDARGRKIGSWFPAEPATSADCISGAAPLPRIVTLVVRRDVCEAVGGFDETLEHVEDLEFMYRVLLRGEFVAVPDQLVYYRQHRANISHIPGTDGRDAYDRMLTGLIELCQRRGDSTSAALFKEQLPRMRARAYVASLRELRAAVRRRSGADTGAEIWWMVRRVSWLAGAVPHAARASWRARRSPRGSGVGSSAALPSSWRQSEGE